MDRIFVQFYSHNSFDTPPKYRLEGGKHVFDHRPGKTLLMANGFSNIHNYVKDDIYWVHYPFDGSYEETFQRNMNVELPIDKGIAYVSTQFITHLRQVFVWAIRYPNIKFVAGGAAIRRDMFDHKLHNVELTSSTTEEYFKQPCKWGLTPPVVDEPERTAAVFGYHLGEECNWNKCIFCQYSVQNRKTVRFDLDVLDRLEELNETFPRIAVQFSYPSVTAKMLDMLPDLTRRKRNWSFMFFIRSDKAVTNKLKKILPQCNNPEMIRPFVGLEFPSNRMLQIINKGITLDDYLAFKEVTDQYGVTTYTKLILGWPNLTQGDADEAENFFQRIPKKNTNMIFGGLLVQPNSPLYRNSKELIGEYDKIERWNGPFYTGDSVILNEEQQRLNDSIIQSCYNNKIDYIWDSWSDLKFRYEQAT